MEYLLYWILIGWSGGGLLTYLDHRKGIDFKVSDLSIGLLVSGVIGPLMLFVVLYLTSDYVLVRGKGR